MLASRAPIWSDEIVVEPDGREPTRRRGALLAVAATVALIAAGRRGARQPGRLEPDRSCARHHDHSRVDGRVDGGADDERGGDHDQRAGSDPFAEMEAERIAALSSFDSVSFTATVSEQYDGQPENTTNHTNDVVLRNDGSLWATGDTILMNSFDAATGVARLHFVQADGSSAYQEVVGWTDNSVPLMTMLGGVDPTGPVDVLDGATIEATTLDGRDVWRVGRTLAMDGDEQTDTWTVDRATGLIVGYDVDWVYDGASRHARRSVVISDVVLGAELPPEFPGSFPEGAVVDRSGDPNGFRLATVAEAATAFGDGFVLPADLANDARITLRTYDSNLSDPVEVAAGNSGEVVAPTISVEIITRVGFTRTVTTLTKMRPPLTGVPGGYMLVGDALCPTSDGVTCRTWSEESEITAGDWAGASSNLEQTSISAERDGITLSVNAPTAEEALALANSLTSV